MPIASDMGDCLFTAMDIEHTALLAPGYYATMGTGIPFGLGLQAASGKRPLVLVGDGAFQMTGWELGNCRRLGLNPIVLLFNNTAWGMLKAFQKDTGYNDLDDWHFAELAETLGGKGRSRIDAGATDNGSRAGPYRYLLLPAYRNHAAARCAVANPDPGLPKPYPRNPRWQPRLKFDCSLSSLGHSWRYRFCHGRQSGQPGPKSSSVSAATSSCGTATSSRLKNSQHIFDWYSPSHVLHGLVFYLALHFLLPKLDIGWRLVMACGHRGGMGSPSRTQAGSSTNTAKTPSHWIITATGVVNSLSDMTMMVVGFIIAARAPVWLSISLFIAAELLVGTIIRDGLLLNIIMLLYPLDWIRHWQAG